MDFTSCDAQRGLEELCLLLCQSALLPPEEAALALGLLKAANEGDFLLAARQYGRLSAALWSLGARRVSGDLWRDLLLYSLLQRPHPLARAAARGQREGKEALAFEMGLLGRLFSLRGEDLTRMLRERQRALRIKPKQGRDNISAFSTAVWSGAAVPEGESAPAAAAYIPRDLSYPSWRYGDAGLRDGFAADEALEEVYARLMESADWTERAEDVLSFFSAYGCGALLQSRAFRFDGALAPLCERVLGPLDEPVCYKEQRDRLLNHVIRFMQGERVAPVLLTGGAGTGKTAQLLSLPYELPELRLVSAEARRVCELLPLLEEQPLRFAVLLDGENHRELDRCFSELLSFRRLPDNVLLCCACREAPATEGMERIHLPYLTFKEFSDFVGAVLAARHTPFDPAGVRDLCVDHQVDARDRLCAAGALRVADRYENG